MSGLRSLAILAIMEGQLCKGWDGLHVSPNTAPSKEAKLCTYLACFLCSTQLRTLPHFEIPMSTYAGTDADAILHGVLCVASGTGQACPACDSPASVPLHFVRYPATRGWKALLWRLQSVMIAARFGQCTRMLTAPCNVERHLPWPNSHSQSGSWLQPKCVLISHGWLHGLLKFLSLSPSWTCKVKST